MSSTHELPARGANPSPLPDAPPADGEHSTGHSMLVGAILAVVAVSTLMMVGFIWFRAHGVREPTTAIFVNGDPTLAGTMVTISSAEHEPITAKLSASNAYTVSALLEPGQYRVTARHGQQVLLLQDVGVKRFVGPRFDLSQSVKKGLAEGTLQPLEKLEPEPSPDKP